MLKVYRNFSREFSSKPLKLKENLNKFFIDLKGTQFYQYIFFVKNTIYLHSFTRNEK